MSCDIIRVHTIRTNLTITVQGLEDLRRDVKSRPAYCFLSPEAQAFKPTDDPNVLEVTKFNWRGWHIQSLIQSLKAFKGEAELALVWEDGDLTGFRVKDGEVTEHQIALAIALPPAPPFYLRG